MAKPPFSHYSPVFANKSWADSSGYATYYFDQYKGKVVQKKSGRSQWGRERGLYTWEVEHALNRELENEAAKIYQNLLQCKELDEPSRLTWAQFLLSQIVRTPTFIRYEKIAEVLQGTKGKPAHDRVGCKECGDLLWVTRRNWILMAAHADDYFVRSDNPVFLTGFLERPETCLFYPLSPRVCFVACSMPNSWDANREPASPPKFGGHVLSKGGAHMINFHFAKAAGETLVMAPENNGNLGEKMFSEVLGIYPQPPFSLHVLDGSTLEDAYESIRILMSSSDHLQYPSWLPMELEPFGLSGSNQL